MAKVDVVFHCKADILASWMDFCCVSYLDFSIAVFGTVQEKGRTIFTSVDEGVYSMGGGGVVFSLSIAGTHLNTTHIPSQRCDLKHFPFQFAHRPRSPWLVLPSAI